MESVTKRRRRCSIIFILLTNQGVPETHGGCQSRGTWSKSSTANQVQKNRGGSHRSLPHEFRRPLDDVRDRKNYIMLGPHQVVGTIGAAWSSDDGFDSQRFGLQL